jgi:arylsulfatase A-like enzyme
MADNLVLVTIDSLRADHVGSYGYERDTTPRLDEYARAGHRFTNAFAHACATRPSFPAILTSSHPLMHGGFERLSADRTLISEVFSELGYETAGFHSNLYLSAEFGYDRGFDTLYDSREDPSLTTRLRQAVKDNLNSDGLLYGVLERLYQGAERRAGVDVGSHYVSAEELTDRALEWARARRDEPSFLWVHYMDPHHPYAPPDEHQRFSSVGASEGVRLRPKMMENHEDITDEELSTLVDLYDGEVRYTDEQVGRLLSELDDCWSDWTAFVTADHGEEFRDHGEFFHQNRFYDEVMHVPLIVYDGDSTGTHDEMVGLLDVAPTIAERAGATDLPEAFWGHSLEPLLSGRLEDWPREGILGSWCDVPTGERRLVYRTADWKYIRDYVNDREQLFDLQADPAERDNLAEAKEPPAVVETMRAVTDEYEADIEATAANLEDVEMDEAVKERLRNLGYAE